MDKEEDAFDISAVPGGCSRSLAKSYKREVILGRVWISVHRFGLVYSHCVFETCLNICYWCMNNTAIYNSFLGKKTVQCHQERPSACMEAAFIFVPYKARINLKKVQAPSLFQGEVVFLSCVSWPGRVLSRIACASWPVQASPKPGSWGSSRLSLCQVLQSPLVINVRLCCLVKRCHPAWYPYFSYLLEKLSPSPWSPHVWST